MNMSKILFKSTLVLLGLLLAFNSSAQQYSKVTYVHSEADGTAFAATDSQGNVEWQIDHYPYGGEVSNTEVARKSDISFAGKPYDEEIGLSYFGARWYDPDIGRFTGMDPMPVNPNDYRTFNRYAYAFNNPYKYQDPDGRLAFLIPIAIFFAKELAAEAASRATGGLTDFLSVRKMGTKVLRKGAKAFQGSGNKLAAKKVSRENRWLELANEPNSRLPKEMIDHINKHNGKGVSGRFGQELAHKPKKAAVQGHDYSEAIQKTAADHRGIQHRYLKERSTGTTISMPKKKRGTGKLSLPPKGALP